MITEAESYRGDAVLLPDGAASMYGRSQEHLRTQAAQIIGPSFQSAFGSVYVSGFPSADLTYPEVAAADYIAGYVRAQMDAGEQPTERYDSVVWFNRDWRDATSSPLPFYQIKGLTGSYGRIEQTRVAAWIKGRYTGDESHDVASQWQNTVRILESQTLQEYLLNGLGP
ncbi:hypothetical protein [Halarchaeum salinum]|uniref:Uncharacterized protein n=1 Tax=Halarchaeum salinum TaxID=489912 RepID=A0AAV3S151_9EURY